MIIKKVKIRKYTALILGVCILLSTLFISTGTAKKKDDEGFRNITNSGLSKNEQKTAEDISNMTGVKIEEVMKLKDQGKSWNEILESIKDKNKSQNGQKQENERRSGFMAESGIGNDYVEKLKNEGFRNEEISEAKMLIERVLFQLNELTSDESNIEKDIENLMPTPGVDRPNEGKEDMDSYNELKNSIDEKTAVYLILKLKREFGSMEKVFDEYLLSLQMGLTLESYLIDKDSYTKEKEKKSVEWGSKEIITMEKIESQMLEKLKNRNSINKDSITGGKENTEGTNQILNQSEIGNNAPEFPLQNMQDTKPEDPLEGEMREINAIKEKSLNLEGR